MIETISIGRIATYIGSAPQELADLRTFNYIFGSNGTGKTTISRIIADETCGTDCSIIWKQGIPLETLVLNRDFAERHFGQLSGVFTLGEQQKDTLDKIDAAKVERDKENQKLAGLKIHLKGDDGMGGKQGELAQLERDFAEKCWAQKQKHDPKLHGAFTGYRKSVQRFKQKILEEAESNSAPLYDLSDLESKSGIIFGEAPAKESVIPNLEVSMLLGHETSPILKKKVIGKGDVDIAAMIQKLGNSDWVQKGREYYDQNGHLCPFCQQTTTEAFAASLNDYFDETFATDVRAIDALRSRYASDSSDIQTQLGDIIAAPSQFLDAETLQRQKTLLDERINTNRKLLEAKKNQPSQVIELESLDAVLTSIKTLLDAANEKVADHNRLVANLKSEQTSLTNNVWCFVLDELDVDLKQYRDKKSRLEKAIDGIREKITEGNIRIKQKKEEIRELESQRTSIQPTIDDINAILSSFGFDSFKLAMADDCRHYKLVRTNGDDAGPTLSEGERSFVVFLYFYHLLKGSMEESGMTTDRIVAFDDPVSSLDSDVLFIVSSLIKNVCEKVRSGTGHIKQVFVLTHNVYFHKEVTYNFKRPNGEAWNEESFWMVRKSGPDSTVERHHSNPISTSYELLWMEVKNPDSANPRIENTLRRILEHYFTILGSIDRDEICAKFEEHERSICRSLFSWVNAGSHAALDDAHITSSESMMAKYVSVFRSIFEKTGHIAHYEMMMGDGEAQRSVGRPR